MLCILGWLATEQGNHALAIELVSRSKADLNQHVELLSLLGIAQQRAEQREAAVAIFQQLVAQHPDSPFAEDARFRRITLLPKLGRAGEAIEELADMIDQPPPYPRLHFESELWQWFDTLVQFAPVEEILSAVNGDRLQEADQLWVRGVLRARLMATGRFDEARSLVETEPLGSSTHGASRAWDHVWRFFYLDEARWETEVEPIRDALRQVEKEETAGNLYALGRAWEKARGRLLMPALDSRGICHDDEKQTSDQRLKNGLWLGYRRSDIELTLDGYDELYHAHQAYARASESAVDESLAAQALETANTCLWKMAELSPYHYARAVETKRAEKSRLYWKRLAEDYPETPEAQRAVFWSFPPASECPWLPGDSRGPRMAHAILDAFHELKPGTTWDQRQMQNRFAREIGQQLEQLSHINASHTLDYRIQAIGNLRLALRTNYHSLEQAHVMNAIDDWLLYLRAIRDRKREVSGIWPIEDDFMAYRAIKPSSPNEATSLQAFLTDYPNSPKSEAALFRLVRLRALAVRSHARVVPYHWPEASNPWGYKKTLVTMNPGADFDPARRLLDRYGEAYPKGRYAADVILLRALLAVADQDWDTALDNLCNAFDDQAHRELHLDAALQLADVFMKLLEPQIRPDLLNAISRQPAAKRRLRQFMRSQSFGSRLKILKGFMEHRGI